MRAVFRWPIFLGLVGLVVLYINRWPTVISDGLKNHIDQATIVGRTLGIDILTFMVWGSLVLIPESRAPKWLKIITVAVVIIAVVTAVYVNVVA